jgi:hypothetical protein
MKLAPSAWSLRLQFGASEGWMGGALYVENLVASLLRLPRASLPPLDVRFLSPDNVETADRIRALLAASGDRSRLRERLAALARRPGLTGRLARWLRPEASPGPTVVFPVFVPGTVTDVPLYWIPDFQHRFLPECFSGEELAQRDGLHARIAALPGMLLVSSRFARDNFLEHHPKARITVRVWSFCSNITAAQADPAAVASLELPERYLYLPNQFWAHKNHLGVFKALRLLRDKGLRVPLVCTGYKGDPRRREFFDSLQDFLRQADLLDQVRILGLVPRATQIEIFRRAVAVLQPSFFEGWSTVIEDAKALGRPIIASDFPVHFEQLRDYDRVSFFRRHDIANMTEVLERTYGDGIPGPDAAREQQASLSTKTRQHEAALEFLAIAESALRATG